MKKIKMNLAQKLDLKKEMITALKNNETGAVVGGGSNTCATYCELTNCAPCNSARCATANTNCCGIG